MFSLKLNLEKKNPSIHEEYGMQDKIFDVLMSCYINYKLILFKFVMLKWSHVYNSEHFEKLKLLHDDCCKSNKL